MKSSEPMSRREFLEKSACLGAAGASLPYFVPARALGKPGRPGPNDKIRIGLIGASGQGNWNLTQLLAQPDVVITAVCEVHKPRLEQTLARCGGTAKGYGDYRDVLARDDVDAVLIATPPHWHALMAVDAAKAGKDFYLEKPMTLYPAETLAVKRAVEKYKVITQIGTQIHATKNYRRIVDVIRSGVLGPISTARTFHVLNQGPKGIGYVPDTAPPEGLDWDMWLGPAPKRGFNALLFKDSAHHTSFMAYSGGWTPGMAPHIIDVPFWALELGVPTVTMSSGGRYVVHDCGDAYDFHEVMWQFPNFTLTWWTSLVNSYGFDNQGGPGLHRRRCMYFHGTNGTLVGDYELLKIIPEADRMKGFKLEDVPQVIPDSPGHHREWLDGIRTRKPPSCHVGYHYKIDLAITLSLLSLKLGRSIRIDPKTEEIVGDNEAARLAIPEYRPPWNFPKV